MAASIALYTTLSLAPLLIIAVAVAGMVFGATAVDGAVAAQAILSNAGQKSTGIASAAAGVLIHLIGASLSSFKTA